MTQSLFITQLIRRGWFVAGVVLSLAGVASAADLKAIQPFLEAHCYDCHSDGNAKGGLDFDKLDKDLTKVGTVSKWVRIHDRVARGEMPPPGKSAAKDAAPHKPAFLASLSSTLTQASAAHAHTVIRRLNRVEYENTLRDLLNVRTELRGMLPEDGKAHGFDNVGDALDLSAVQMARYMEAAGKALDESISRGPKPELTIANADIGAGRNAEFVGKSWFRRADGALVFYNDGGYPGIKPGDFRVNAEGLYRIRISGDAHQSPKPITFAAHVGSDGFTGTVQTSYHQFVPNEVRTVTIEAFMRPRETVRLMPQGLPNPYNDIKKDGVANYKGPGLAVTKLEIEGPIISEWPTAGHKARFGDLLAVDVGPENQRKNKNYRPRYEVSPKDPAAEAARVMPIFAQAAFRRPVTTAEVAPFVQLAKDELSSGATFEQAMRTAHIAILCSPDFLYLIEQPGRLDDYALASRLSYMLWGTLPDAALLDAAAKKQLSTPAGLRAQTERLLTDPRAARFTKNFTGQWLNLREIDFTVPDKQLYPEYDDQLKDAMVLETELFFEEVLKKNLSLLNFTDSDWTMLNERLARHYRIDGVTGTEMRKVTLKPEYNRGGVLTHASVLKVSANGTTTSPVVRGAWVLERIIGFHPPPPPPGVPGVEPDIRGATTLRQQLDQHRSNETCNSCHRVIDPPGFALESYDVMGGYRENYRSLNKSFPGPKGDQLAGQRYVNWRIGPKVDATGVTDDGKPFSGLPEYKKILLADPQQLARALAEKLATYGTGRGMGFSDRATIDRIATAVAAKKYGFRDLVHEVVQSEVFRSK